MRLLAILIVVHAAVAAADDWGPRRDPFDRVVIARYQQLLARDAEDPILDRLVELYRRYRTVGQLVADYETRLAGAPDDVALVVVTGRLRDAAGDRAGALELYERALALRPADPAIALRLGKAQRAAGNLREARAAFVRAVDRPDALRALIELSRAAGDRVDVAIYTSRLAALEPTSARTQLDRGDALAAIGLVDGAVDAYARAEALYGSDTARKLDAIAARGRALEATRPRDAEREYRRAMAAAPKGYYLAAELFDRLFELHRAQGTIDALLARTLEDWPESRRGTYEWTQLARLYDAIGRREAGTAALAKAVTRSTDPLLHFQLADRVDRDAGLAILDKLAARSARDVITLTSIAERYMRWGKTVRASEIYRKIAQLDPNAEDRVVAIVEAYLKSDDRDAASKAMRSAGKQLVKAASFARLGEVMLEWGRFAEAADVYTQAIAREPNNPAHWRGRAAARDSLGQLADALEDAREVIRLTADLRQRQRARKEAVRIAMHANPDGPARTQLLDAWRSQFAASPPDADAGALLLAYFEVSPCDALGSVASGCETELIATVDKLAQLEPIDVDQILAVATAYAGAQNYEAAIKLLELVSKLAPDRRADIAKHLDKVRAWYGGSGVMPHPSHTAWLEDPDDEIQALRARRRGRDAITSRVRAGLRLGAGAGLRGDADRLVTVGVGSAVRFARNLSILTRLDWSESQGDYTVNAVGLSAGVGSSILTTKHTTLVLGIAERLEQRWGKMLEADARTGLAADVTLDLIGRHVPIGGGVRFEQGLSQGGRTTSLLFEVAIELR